MRLEEIDWPVFKLGINKPIVENNIVYYTSEYYVKDTQEFKTSIRVIDNRNLAYATLGLRRLILRNTEKNLYPIKTAIYFIGDLIKLAKPNVWFIDNLGRFFQYKKTKRVKLVCYKIKTILPNKGLGSILELENHTQRYKCMFSPRTQRYVGLLHINNGYVLYGLYDEPFKSTYRAI